MNNDLHKLVKDLFPNYIEKLTSDETNKFIEDHISSCEECKKSLEKMKAEMKEEKYTDLKDKKVNFAKKVNRRLKLSKLFILLIIITILVVVGDYIRKVMIVNKLKNLEWKYENCSNYKVEQNFTVQLGRFYKITDFDTCYFKDGKFLRVSEAINSNNVGKEDLFRERTATKDFEFDNKTYYFQYQNNKISDVEITNIGNGPEESIDDLPTFKSYQSKGYLPNMYKDVLTRKITTEKFDGIDCYKIETYDHEEVLYFEKGTGLLRKSNDMEYYYYFDCVEDDVFELPEIPEDATITIDGIKQTGGDSYEE